MKKNDSRQNFLQQTAACVLVIGSVALTGDGDAATAAGTATATVLELVSVSISAPPPVPAAVVTPPVLSGTLFTVESFTGSLSPSGPLLRFGSNPPPGFMVAAVPSTVDGATVNVTRNADGSLSVSGGSGLTFAVSRPDAGAVIIEYN
ncbi:MAG: hypothetical protein JJD98_09895 [Polaromonas sp.]|nr:hypothetical protein [Polaromonas sp.]